MSAGGPVPGTIRKFGESPFNSSSVKRVLLGEGITETSRFCFVSCTELTDVSLPTTMQHLSVSTFNNCSSLETIHIPYACHIIDDCAFYRTGLKEIYAEDHRRTASKKIKAFRCCPYNRSQMVRQNGYGFRGV